MARHIKTVIELTKKETKEFLASLQSDQNDRKVKAALDDARKTKFNLVL